MDNSSTSYDLNLSEEPSLIESGICEAINCQSEAIEEIQLKVGGQFLTVSLCKNCVGEFKDD
jgi:hypothetical protein